MVLIGFLASILFLGLPCFANPLVSDLSYDNYVINANRILFNGDSVTVTTDAVNGEASIQIDDATPGGTNGQVQFNDNGVFNGTANIFYQESTGNVGIGNNNPVALVHIDGSTAIGKNVTADGETALAVGNGSAASGDNSLAIGFSTTALGEASTAMGSGSFAAGVGSMAIGIATASVGTGSFAVGNTVRTDGDYAMAFGEHVNGDIDHTMVFGVGNSAADRLINNYGSNDGSLVVGFNSNYPTIYVGPASGGSTLGNVGIGTTNPSTLLEVNGALTINGAFTFPVVDGAANQVLTTNGSGVVTWGSAAGASSINDLSDAIADSSSVYLGNGSAGAASGIRNVAIGIGSYSNGTFGGSNVAIGYNALSSVTTSSSMVAIGSQALRDTTGSANVAIGASVGADITTGTGNTLLGSSAGGSLSDADSNNVSMGYNTMGSSPGDENVCVGASSCLVMTSEANGNTVLGYNAGNFLSGTHDNIIIGNSVGNTFGVSNQINIGDTIYGDRVNGDVSIGIATPGSKLHVNGVVLANEVKVQGNGVVALAERSPAPSSVSDFGQLYVKSSDSNLYFKDDGGTETQLNAFDFAARTSTSTQSVTSTATAIPWQTEVEAGSIITWNSGNNTRLTVTENGTYSVGGYVTVQSAAIRAQVAVQIYINGASYQSDFRSSSYIRNSGSTWDFWVQEVASTPIKLEANDYVEFYICTVTLGSYSCGGSISVTVRGASSQIWAMRLN